MSTGTEFYPFDVGLDGPLGLVVWGWYGDKLVMQNHETRAPFH